MTEVKKDVRDIMEQLQAPFASKDIEWRVQSSGMSNGKAWALIMPYVTNRAIQQRLDRVFGFHNWENEYREVMRDNKLSFLCGITVWYDGKKTTKWDGADETDFESFKGGLSNSMKRSAVHYGIGRYLYNLPTQFAELQEGRGGEYVVKIKDGNTYKTFSYNSPKLPSWALPEGEKNHNPETKKEDPYEKELDKMGARNLTAECDACNTLEELKTWYEGFPKEERGKGTPVYKLAEYRKQQLSKATAEPSTGNSKIPEFDEMKKMTVAGLYLVCEEIGIPATEYKKLKKADLINYLLKIKQGA